MPSVLIWHPVGALPVWMADLIDPESIPDAEADAILLSLDSGNQPGVGQFGTISNPVAHSKDTFCSTLLIMLKGGNFKA